MTYRQCNKKGLVLLEVDDKALVDKALVVLLSKHCSLLW